MAPFAYPDACEPNAARAVLAELIEQAIEGAAQPRGSEHPRALRVEAPLQGIRPISWLRAQSGSVKTYWYDRDDEFEVAGLGAADLVSRDPGDPARDVDLSGLLIQMRDKLSSTHLNLRYYGGLRFDGLASSAGWSAFGAYRFVLPRFEALKRGEQTYLACNVLLRPGESKQSILDETLQELNLLNFEAPASWSGSLTPVRRGDLPERAQWDELIAKALSDFQRGALEKVVLARKTTFQFADVLEPLAVLERLVERTLRSYHFCFQLDESTAFLGASPELLYKRQSRFVQSEAVAGTRARGATDAADEVLGEALLRSEKDRREHQFVLDTVRGVFNRLCHVVYGDPEVCLLKLRSCQHLFYHLEGILRDWISDADLLGALHPTPAVGGYPAEAAIERIRAWEPFDRGWYAGPVGWVGYNMAEFAVGIRSGLVLGDALHLYAGAGIVSGSDAASEWDEIEGKMDSFLSALRGAGPNVRERAES